MDKIIQVALADDHKIFRDGVKAGLKKYKQIKLIWEAENAKAMLEKIRSAIPDVLFISIQLPNGDTVKTIRSLHKEYSHLKIIALSNCNDQEAINQIMSYGANGFLNKTTEADEMYQAAVTCCRDSYYFNEAVNTALLNKIQHNTKIKKLYPKEIKFNERELNVIKLIGDDKTTEEIATEIFSSKRTVENIRQNMKIKLGVKHTAGLLMYAVRNKLIE